MAEFKISLQKTLAHEGEYVNDPVDSGKETYRGISQTTVIGKAGPLSTSIKSNPIFLSV